MSAAIVILPRVWATASLAAAAHGLHRGMGQKKGPHSLQLVNPGPAAGTWAVPKVRRTPVPGLVFYRKYTEGLLRRYVKLSLEAGRVPSLLGRELLFGSADHTVVNGFDDVVIFVHDVGNCIARLNPGQQYLIRKIALEDYSQEETAAMAGVTLRTVVRRYTEAVDLLTRMLLDRKMLQPMQAAGEDL